MVINEVVIFESLPPRDKLRTGVELHKRLTSNALPIPVTLVKVHTPGELLSRIFDLADRAYKQPWVPIIHFELHGVADRDGLVTSSGEFISWNQLAEALRDVNIATRNSLIVVMGVCSGAFLSTAAANSPYDRAPFCGVIAPDAKVVDFLLLHGFVAFYQELLDSGDFLRAVNERRQRSLPEYAALDTAALFRRGMEVYDEKLLARPVRVKRVKKILRKAPPAAVRTEYGSRNKARAAIAHRLTNHAERTRKAYEHFIMADIYPENATRFCPLDAA